MLIPSAVITYPSPTIYPDMTNGLLITTPGADARTVPSGVTVIDIEIWGGGGAAGFYQGVSPTAGGGGGGAYCKRISKSVTPGQVISYVIGNSGAQTTSNVVNPGTSTTCDSMTAGGGGGGLGSGIGSGPGAGGTATGGDTNTNGSSGLFSGSNSGNAGGNAGGGGGSGGSGGVLGGSAPTAGSNPGGGGGSAAIFGHAATGMAGAPGGIKFTF